MNKARQLTNVLQEFSIPLIIGVLAGLAVANIDQEFYKKLVDYDVFGEATTLFGHHLTIEFFIKGVFMVFFFGIAAKEITESALQGGPLNTVSRAINPLLGTLGGVFGPVGLYFLLTFVFYGGTDNFTVVADGWGIPTATDIALAWLVARLVFGNGHPAVNFLLLLAVADDAIGLGIIAVFYPDPDLPVKPAWLLLTAGGIVVAFAMRRMKINHWVPYIVIAGTMSWFGLLRSSIEPALALVPIVPFLPGPRTDTGLFIDVDNPNGEAHQGTKAALAHAPGHNPLQQFEHHLKLFVDMGLFFFAFAAAGATFGGGNEVTLIVLLSLIGGKTIGISLFSTVGEKFGFPLPSGMRMKHLVVAGLIAGLGLTVALFVTEKAFPEPSSFQDPAKVGAVLSAGVALLAFIAGAALRVKDGAGASVGKS